MNVPKIGNFSHHFSSIKAGKYQSINTPVLKLCVFDYDNKKTDFLNFRKKNIPLTHFKQEKIFFEWKTNFSLNYLYDVIIIK